MSAPSPDASLDESVTSAELRMEMSRIEDALANQPQWIPSSQSHGRIGFHGISSSSSFVAIDLRRPVRPDEIVLFPARVGAGNEDSASGFPPELEIELSDDPEFATFRRLVRWQEDEEFEGARLPLLRLPGNGVSGRYLRIRVFGGRLRRSGKGRYFSFGEIVVLENGRNVALGKSVLTSRSIENKPRWQAENLTDGFLWCLPFVGTKNSPANGFHSGIEAKSKAETKWVEVDLGTGKPVDEIRLFPAHPQDFADTAGFGFPHAFRLLGFRENGEKLILFHSEPEPNPNPGAAAVMIPLPSNSIQRIRFETNALWQRTGDFLYAMAELEVWGNGEKHSLDAEVSSSDETESGSWARQALTDGFSSRHELLNWTTWLNALDDRRNLERRHKEIATILAYRAEHKTQLWFRLLVSIAITTALVAVIVVLRQRRLTALAGERMRNRIAADLHDELGASLSHLALQGELAARELSAEDPEAKARISRLSETARATLDDMRDVVWLLRKGPTSWEDFARRLESIATRLLDEIDHEITIDKDLPAGQPAMVWSREIVLFMKEAIANARRHSNASTIKVKVSMEDNFQLLIHDNGKGFDPNFIHPTCDRDLHDNLQGMGIQNLQKRAARLGGSCLIESEEEIGTGIHLTVPFPTKP
ncbi:MAG: histidine kinase [Verrucomicrobiales bacterium]|nr:histidine kinase [Verrucomicrobiales bacterium]